MSYKTKFFVKKGLFVLFIFLLIIAVCAGIYAGYLTVYFITADTSGTANTDLTYHMDENYEYIIDIPFEEYLIEESLDTNAVIFDICDYGASTSASGSQNGYAINDAINACFEAGGGVVLISGGTYVSSSIELKSNVTLKIDEDSVLENMTATEVSLNLEQYSNDMGAFIWAYQASNISILGAGTIDSNGESYSADSYDSSAFFPLDTFNLQTYITEHRKRIRYSNNIASKPYPIYFKECENVTIRNVQIRESSHWNIKTTNVDNLLIENVVLNNNINIAHTDGIDICGGNNITINHCFVTSADDGICLKTENGCDPLTNVYISNCEVMSLANPFKIGTAVYNDIYNIYVTDCFFFMPEIAGGYGGISIEAPDGGDVHDVYVDNITMQNILAPLLIWQGNRNTPNGNESDIYNISVSNITATNCDVASAVVGYNGNQVKNITLSNFDITYRDCDEYIILFPFAETLTCRGEVDGYPEITKISHLPLPSTNEVWNFVYFDLPVYGIYCEYVDGLTLDNISITPRTVNTRDCYNFTSEEDSFGLTNLTII